MRDGADMLHRSQGSYSESLVIRDFENLKSIQLIRMGFKKHLKLVVSLNDAFVSEQSGSSSLTANVNASTTTFDADRILNVECKRDCNEHTVYVDW